MTDREDGQVRAFEARLLRSRGPVVLTPGKGWVDVAGRSGTVRYEADEVEARVSTDLEQGRLILSRRPDDPEDVVYGPVLRVLTDISPKAQLAVRAVQVVVLVAALAVVLLVSERTGRPLAGVVAAFALVPVIVRWRGRLRRPVAEDRADPAETVARLLKRSGIAVEKVRFTGIEERYAGRRMIRWEVRVAAAGFALCAGILAVFPAIPVLIAAAALTPEDQDRTARTVALVVALPPLTLILWHVLMVWWARIWVAGHLRDRWVARYRRPRRSAVIWALAYGLALAAYVVFVMD